MIKKVIFCRSCKSNKLKKVFSLGTQYLTGIFTEKYYSKVSRGPLSLSLCNRCSLLQLDHNFNHLEMYGENYGYMSSLNNSMKFHLEKKAKNLVKKYFLKKNDLVIDIGSNDGTFLSFFPKKINLIGIEIGRAHV